MVNWALVLGLYLGDVIKGVLLVLGLFFNPILGLRLGPAHLLFQTPLETKGRLNSPMLELEWKPKDHKLKDD